MKSNDQKHISQTYDVILKCLNSMLYDRIKHFNKTDHIFRKRRRTQHLGFEKIVVADLYRYLRNVLGDCIYIDFPSGHRGSIDLGVLRPEELVLVEIKMYYSDTRNAYSKDFNKLKPIVDEDSSVIAVLVHFHFYENRNYPAQSYFQELAENLSDSAYWCSLDYVGDKNGKHFCVLGFQNQSESKPTSA